MTPIVLARSLLPMRALALALIGPLLAGASPEAPLVPQFLEETGLYADVGRLVVDPRHLAFTPQYPLWTDGASKRRWIALPAGTVIDGSDPNNWIFPVGTRLWKEFSFGGQRIETRYLERQADGWRYGVYAWSADGRSAALVPDGRRRAYPLAGGRAHRIPSLGDCKACHEGGRGPVLGFSALQLSPDRDPNAPHAEAVSGADLAMLIDTGLLIGLPASLREAPPRIATTSATERATLGYLHGNCGHCHNARGALRNLGLVLSHTVGTREQAAISSTVAHPVRNPAPGQSADALMRIEPQHPERSALLQRMASRYGALQMPPLGTEIVDAAAVALIRRWIADTTPLHPSEQQKGH